jgi:CubicO group peptidase (beta-lactamase class C family)
MLHIKLASNLALAAFCATLVTAPAQAAKPVSVATVASFPLTKTLREEGFSGSLLVTRRGKVLANLSQGYAERSFMTPVKRVDRFPIASITKLFTSVAVLRLVEQGRVELDAPFRKYLPAYPGPGAEHITVRQLLGHMSGLPQFDTVASLDEALTKGLPQYQTPRTARQLLELCCSKAPTARPGERFDYNNADYIVLGQLIEAVTGQPYETALRPLVLDPLGLRNTGMMRWDRPLPRLVRTYFLKPGEKSLINDLPVFPENWYAAAGLYSTVDDVAVFSDALFRRRLLKPASMTALLTPAGDDYGLGLWTFSFKRKGVTYDVAKRPGRIMGANSMLYRLPEQDVSIVILANSNAVDLDRLAQDLAEAVIDGRALK